MFNELSIMLLSAAVFVALISLIDNKYPRNH